jgi:predicted AAA+ superfamily ATPase
MAISLIKRFFPEIDKNFFLFGPRGTGKSTLMHMRFENALWINLLLPEVLRSFLARPERLSELVMADQKKSIIVIDEVQKAPQLLSVVHHLIEEKRGWQFILTGSSARKLKHTSANLLGGRALKRVLHPFMAAELGKNFSLSDALQNGMLPLLYQEKHPHDVLQAYITLYLREEIQAEGLVRNVENFSRFLEVITFSHASLLNLSNISRECEVKRKTVENYVEILEDLLLAFRLPIFSKRAQRELSSHPKFYLFDAGVYHVLRPKGPLDRAEEIQGAALEGLIASHLQAWNDYSADKYTLAFWRTRAGLEVDFIVYGENGFWAIEVKNAKKISSIDTRGLEAFLEDYPMAKAILLYRGKEYLQIKNVLCVPCEEFLLQLRPDYPLWK